MRNYLSQIQMMRTIMELNECKYQFQIQMLEKQLIKLQDEKITNLKNSIQSELESACKFDSEVR